jgi:crossover junction endodeoxyribonuclease RuvC
MIKTKEAEKKSPANIVGLDLSLTSSGWSRFERATSTLVSGVVASKKKGMERLHEIVETLDKEIPKDSEVYIENYGFSSKGQVVYQGELGGIVRYHLWKKGVPYRNVPPTVAKKFLTGSGVCEKSLILKELYKKYKVDVNDDNEADAIVLGLVGRAIHEDIETTKAQKEAISKVDKE